MTDRINQVTETAQSKGNFTNAETLNIMKATTPWGELGRPAEVAKAAVFLSSDDAAWVTGIGMFVDQLLMVSCSI